MGRRAGRIRGKYAGRRSIRVARPEGFFRDGVLRAAVGGDGATDRAELRQICRLTSKTGCKT